MMRTLWNAASFLAVVNLLAILLFVGWLWQTKRLDHQRIQSIRELFAMTIPEQAQAEEAAAKQAEADHQRQLDEARQLNPPGSSAAQILLLSRIDEQANQAQRRLREENRLLMDRLTAARDDLQKRDAQFERDKKAWLATEKADQDRRVNEQFVQVVKLFEAIPAKQAKDKIRELISEGKTNQAVAYLDAMNGRSAAAIFKEFKTVEENKLATSLLEKLRTFGTPAGVPEDSPDVAAAAPSN
jgi:hypothetical protein